jgi:hypothetical protein
MLSPSAAAFGGKFPAIVNKPIGCPCKQTRLFRLSLLAALNTLLFESASAFGYSDVRVSCSFVGGRYWCGFALHLVGGL